ncbi:RHS repeat-associated core domain-containing protein [Pseudomonas sp. B21-044]|uniref:RHS repeat-associated core domain-containing protein n=1 Tax=Pseudomonas sp. B21-044 TaxID=2895488 RepID=UPI0021601D7F|nr:RHS repeat-associated core domain-containing protein [Pseudomonas sp. B21-044]UVL20608.1 RHS repeat-associated core domain-containing protein [Pseudomonas sp. B21-044]
MKNLTMCDQQNSVLASVGSVRSYPPYGALSAATGPRLAYCGQLREASTGAYYLGNGHRSYTPRLMRFLSPDALSPFAKGGINAYAYCAGDPINYQDRSGRAKIPIGWAPGNGSARVITSNPGFGGNGSMTPYHSTAQTSTQAYNSSTETLTVDPSWLPGLTEAWMYGSAIVAVGHTLVGLKQMFYNPKAAKANFIAASVNAGAAVMAGVEYSMGVGGSLPMTAGKQLLYGGGSGLVAGAQITSSGIAAHMSWSKPSASSGQSGDSLDMKEFNIGRSSSTVAAGKSEEGALLRGSD